MSENTQDERLLSLEGAVREIGRTSERIAIGQQHMLDKMDAGFVAINSAQASLNSKQENLESRLKPIEDSAKKSSHRAEMLRKAAFPAVAAMAGVFGAKFGSQILVWLGSLLGL